MYGIDIWLGYIAAQNPQIPIQIARHKELLIDNIILDVCNLLNSRSSAQDLNADFLDTPSILDYGVPDVSYYSPYSSSDQETVCKIIAKSLERFEPRLNNMTVSPIEQDLSEEIGFYFRIKANAVLGREQIAVILDSNFSSTTKQFVVTKQS
jgi:type VI secretion system lysozyme-like protein